MINVSSLVEPLGSFPILPYLIQALRAVIREELPEDDQDNLDIWLAPMGHNEVNSHRRVRLVFMAGDRELCKIPYRCCCMRKPAFCPALIDIVILPLGEPYTHAVLPRRAAVYSDLHQSARCRDLGVKC
jgi:hypothetical protein